MAGGDAAGEGPEIVVDMAAVHVHVQGGHAAHGQAAEGPVLGVFGDGEQLLQEGDDPLLAVAGDFAEIPLIDGVVHAHQNGLPCLALGDQVLGIAGRGLKAVGEAHHVFDALFLGGVCQNVSFFRGHGDGFFNVIGFAGLYRGHADFKVGVVGGADIHRIHVGAIDQVVVVHKPVGFVDAVFFTGRVCKAS